jgi:DNA-binding transcriptional regulator YhcF (GntR family)
MANPLIEGKFVSGKFGGKAHYIIKVDSIQEGVEKYYYFVLRNFEQKGPFGLGYSEDSGKVEKIKDVFGASEASSYWGNIEQRKGLQQQKVSEYMATLGKMSKDLFQIIREARIIDERLDYYVKGEKGEESAEIALKGTWIDMVEGGAKNPASVYGLAREVGFVILPDLFFKVNPLTTKDIEKSMKDLEKQGINRKIREILSRKLFQYLEWREKTKKELQVRKRFVLKYLRQHYQSMKLYIDWLKPYLRNIKRLQMQESVSDKDIIASFETNKIELELLGVRKKYTVETYYGHEESREFKKYFPCVRVKFNYVSLPQMSFYTEGQRGAIHRGYSEITFEGFIATKEQIGEYKQKQEQEDLELLASVNEAIAALGDELVKYLEESGETRIEEKPKEVKEEKRDELLDLLKAPFKGFKYVLSKEKHEGLSRKDERIEEDAANSAAKSDCYSLYKVFKQGFGMFRE